jgi:mono/diheme cytochrome c family protein
MVAKMSSAYWFWRVSEGGTVEPYRSKGSGMPAYKDELSVEDRWAVIAYQHSLSEHTGPHVAAEHPEMGGGPASS